VSRSRRPWDAHASMSRWCAGAVVSDAVQDVVFGNLATGWEGLPLRRDGFELPHELDLLPQLCVTGVAVLLGLVRENHRFAIPFNRLTVDHAMVRCSKWLCDSGWRALWFVMMAHFGEGHSWPACQSSSGAVGL
jgi:hypothetical protein